MEEWNGRQRAFAIKMFSETDDSLEGAQREFHRFFKLGRHGRVPSKHTIKTWVQNFEETGSALKKKPTGRPRSVRTQQNIETVRVLVLQSPRRSVRKQAAAVRVSRESVRRILRFDLNFHPYKLQIVQQLKENDHQLRLQFCQQIMTNINEDNEFLDKLWMSDEAHFHLTTLKKFMNALYTPARSQYGVQFRHTGSSDLTFSKMKTGSQ
ncbi:hypothetical protein B7P43_G07116 [Cryptotermes secundus]|uniref:DUF4817 domain-containing protein n=1 Tax=Cryptotermes secundus TaxID=105785 RepID=A0A2J7Q2A5_9NEOP|nr:hypothetical protein B7P43_G07116 [Cryptotermes secundus]